MQVQGQAHQVPQEGALHLSPTIGSGRLREAAITDTISSMMCIIIIIMMIIITINITSTIGVITITIMITKL